MSKNGPVAPSARNQRVAGAVTPALPWPAAKACCGVFRYIARSTTIGTPFVDVITADISASASSGMSSTLTLKRVSPGML